MRDAISSQSRRRIKITAPAVSQREEQKAITRHRIQDAARELFYTQGYAVTTIDQIAIAAGTRRSTLYTHFNDKEDILQSISSDYSARLAAVMSELPGPAPSRAEIDEWIKKISDFVSTARMPTVLLSSLGSLADIPAPVRLVGEQLLRALAANHPAFRRAIEPGPRQTLAMAWASVILRELCWGCLHSAEPGEGALKIGLLSVVGELMENFLAAFS
jgi:AcrR family transcriptional regulator